MLKEYQQITISALLFQYVLYKFFLTQKRLSVSYYIINSLYNLFLFIIGSAGILNPDSDSYANTIITYQKSLQIINLIYEIPHGYSLMLVHHILLLILVNNISINVVTTSYVCCLFVGVPEITSLLYNISYIIHNIDYWKIRLQKTNVLIRVSFCFSFLLIRVLWWSYVGPHVMYRAYSNNGYKIILVTYPIFQSMQYYWGSTIIKKLQKYLTTSKNIGNKCISEYQ